MMSKADIFGYEPDHKYNKAVAYFAMEFGIDQALKTYCGGLGYLAGSHMRSAFALKQNVIGVGILWKYGYYDQVRSSDGLLNPVFIKKSYSFLEDTGIIVTVRIHQAPVHVKAYLLSPSVFGTAPILLLSTDIPENDYLSGTITHRLYDPNESTRIAQTIVLGIGGALVLEALGIAPDVYHMNEGHSVTLGFYLFEKYKDIAEVRRRLVFTTHTPEAGGNEEHRISFLSDMSFFCSLPEAEIRMLLDMNGEIFNYTVAALRFSRRANGVSKLHAETANQMWGNTPGICPILSITNAQNKAYWKDDILDGAILSDNDELIKARKKELKRCLFKIVADQCGKIFDENVLTIVWARRFSGYKRPELIMADWNEFVGLVTDKQCPVQIIWAGKPYPEDAVEIGKFNFIIKQTADLANCAVLLGHELALSALLKRGSDIWLNTPRKYHEASGTSGMTAAMNGSINLSIPDGWVPEFAVDRKNCFLIQTAADGAGQEQADQMEYRNLFDTLTKVVIPMYYHDQEQWLRIIKKAAADIVPRFDSGRLAHEYYEQLYL
ncbi:alpha-glucan family phosphorylase [Mucilaginibacter sp. PPCGB 2223]|uniref:alpha-glucan family phosphorylase n=1 Tax=Mucilaginibacter sp. PPCGB 2223 TaxID=1886027 RepID=UPI00082469D3|nr:alpha-glucan family phosphorylase [Mucilaginibacter sp. PPCGB 2223]OCX54010.1 alpha-glucan family phosphorylase [Mucilaginibacter sp. PPCGB 2223]